MSKIIIILRKLSNTLKKIYNDSLLKNSAYLITTNFFNLILGFFFWVIATRYYTPEDIGIISAILSSMSLISVIGLVGLPMSLMFYLPIYSKNANNIINSCLIIGIIMSITLSLIFILGLDIWAPKLKSYLIDLEVIIIFIIATVMMTISSLMSGTFSAGKRSSFNMIKENIFGFTKIFPLILFTGFGSIGVLLSWSIGLIISVIAGFFLLSKLWKYYPMFIFDPIIKSMTSFSVGNYIAGIMYILPKFVFPIMIVNIISAESAGYFFIAMTIAGLLYGIPYSIASSFLVESSDKDKFWNNVDKAIKFNIGLLIPGLLLFIIFGKFILNLFNPDYADNSFVTLIILSVTSIPISLIIIFNTVRTAQKKIMTVIKINVMLSVMTIIFSIPLMRIWNIEGVAISYLITNTITALVIVFKMKNPTEFILKLIKNNKNIRKDHICNELRI